jgi:uncharacterized membrane protein YkgB
LLLGFALEQVMQSVATVSILLGVIFVIIGILLIIAESRHGE